MHELILNYYRLIMAMRVFDWMPHENSLQWGSVFVTIGSLRKHSARKHAAWISTSDGAASCQLLIAINIQQVH